MYNMAKWAPVFALGASLMLIQNVQCNEDFVSVFLKRLDRLEEDVFRVEERSRDKIDSAKISLQLELKKYLHQYVVAAMKDIIQGESIEEMVRSQVLSEVRQLKRGNHQMKRQLHRVLTSYRDLQEDVNTWKEAMKKTDRDARNMKTCSKYIVDSEILRRDLEQCRDNTENCNQRETQKDKVLLEMEYNLNKLNQTTLLQVTDRNTSASERVTSTTRSITSTPVTTLTTTTAKPEEEKRRIIVAPQWYSTHYQFCQLNIDTNIVTTYPLRSLKYVASVAYISKLRKLLIGLVGPNKIISSNLDSNHMTTVRENVIIRGMAVDEERELIFMTTYHPRYTISRMTTQGKYFTLVIDLADYANSPLSIAVNAKKRTIYACNEGKVLIVTYDGHHLQTLATGSNMYALTLDDTGNILYYNDGKKLMSLSQNVTREVTTLSVQPWNIKYYNKTVYFSSRGSTPTVGAVDVAHDNVMYTLQQNIIKSVSSYIICFVP